MNAGSASTTQPSAELLAAQQRLMELRQALPPRQRPQPAPAKLTAASQAGVSQELVSAQKELLLRRRLAGIEAGATVTQDPVSQIAAPASSNRPPDSATTAIKAGEVVVVYPSLLLAILKQDQAAAGRVYLLLRHLDKAGRGWLPIEEIRACLTNKSSPLKVMGWRRLRQIFHQGEGIFWERDDQGRLWLKSALKIALTLDCSRLKGNRVELPLKVLLGGIGVVKAHFYAGFHSGRRESSPISRETLRELTNVPERTQSEYEQLAGVKMLRNIAVGDRYSQEEIQERSWRQGRATFCFIDFRGRRGQKGREYIAWHMPNSYAGPHGQGCKGRQKKINRELRDLVMKGMRGNAQEKVERLFWPHGAAASKAYNRDPGRDAYWHDNPSRSHRDDLWHVIAAT